MDNMDEFAMGGWMFAAYLTSVVGGTLGLACPLQARHAASAAFWFAVAFDRSLYRSLAGFVMGIAVCAVHYTGMWAVRPHLSMTAPAPTGADVFSFLFPVFVLAGLATAVLICAVLTAPPLPSTDDRRLTATLVQTNSG